MSKVLRLGKISIGFWGAGRDGKWREQPELKLESPDL